VAPGAARHGLGRQEPREICELMKIQLAMAGGRWRNRRHNAHDRLVAWGWNPATRREPAPGTQQQLGQLIAAWVESGPSVDRRGTP